MARATSTVVLSTVTISLPLPWVKCSIEAIYAPPARPRTRAGLFILPRPRAFRSAASPIVETREAVDDGRDERCAYRDAGRHRGGAPLVRGGSAAARADPAQSGDRRGVRGGAARALPRRAA